MHVYVMLYVENQPNCMSCTASRTHAAVVLVTYAGLQNVQQQGPVRPRREALGKIVVNYGNN
jgi:hypothetical protein